MIAEHVARLENQLPARGDLLQTNELGKIGARRLVQVQVTARLQSRAAVFLTDLPSKNRFNRRLYE